MNFYIWGFSFNSSPHDFNGRLVSTVRTICSSNRHRIVRKLLDRLGVSVFVWMAVVPTVLATRYHVAISGDDCNAGTTDAPFRTIQHAAELAQPGDTITVHRGTYREQVNPRRGGTSDRNRIVYEAAKGESVVITGSETVKGWVHVAGSVWKAIVPNRHFGSSNPYQTLIHGDWFGSRGRQHHEGAVYVDGQWLMEAEKREELDQPVTTEPRWFSEVEAFETTIYAQFAMDNPNQHRVEINVRPTCFYPSKSGINYLTVRGFVIKNAATPWAPPTAEQIGAIGTHWSRGWIIENNEICYSKCSGIALGKYGDEWDNRAESAEGYVGTLTRALAHGWDKQTVGSHIVRNNHIHHCEQTGIVGSLGCSFSHVIGNEIHDIYVHRLFDGAEMAGIKFHGAIDVEIRGNHIYHCGGVAGIWLDWMAQGARVTRNLMHDNEGLGDLFLEMQHGPILVDNNILLSKRSASLNAQGVAFVHNVLGGVFDSFRGDDRNTPFQAEHSTQVAGMWLATNGDSGDHRFYNNLILSGCDMAIFDSAPLTCFGQGNLYTGNSKSAKFEVSGSLWPTDPKVKLEQTPNGWYLTLTCDCTWNVFSHTKPVTTELLGRAKVSNCAYESPDGTPLRVDTDFFGHRRRGGQPYPGPFESIGNGSRKIRVW